MCKYKLIRKNKDAPDYYRVESEDGYYYLLVGDDCIASTRKSEVAIQWIAKYDIGGILFR